MRDLEKPFTAVLGGMIRMLGITKLQVSTLQVALKSGRGAVSGLKVRAPQEPREKIFAT